MNGKKFNGVLMFLLGSGLSTMTGLGVAAEKACVPSPAHPCPAILAAPLSKDKAKPVLSPVPVVPMKQLVPLRTVQVWIPKTIQVPSFTGEGYRFQPKTIQVPSFTGEGYRFQPKTVQVPSFTGEGYRSQPMKATVPAPIERGFRKQ